ncbi:MAG: hypothetical protein IKR04_00065 [Clostridia bacterium]|nr:hypothetical protein [Clostridia bacterium]
MTIVEIGIKLDKDFDYYDSALKSNGLECVFQTVTHDVYYTNKNLDGLTENEMKKACIRLRNPNEELKEYEAKLLNDGYKKVFDTVKEDYHYCKEGMHNRVQLQIIKDIGLLVYLDNSDYYEFDEETQRIKLIDELNSYGFNINHNTLGLDKLRTLYYGEEMFSKNQNG